MVVTFKSADETLVCDHSNESYRAVLSSSIRLFLTIVQNEIHDFPLSFELSTLGSERVKFRQMHAHLTILVVATQENEENSPDCSLTIIRVIK